MQNDEQRDEQRDEVAGFFTREKFWCRQCMEDALEAVDRGEGELLSQELLEQLEGEKGLIARCCECGEALE